MMLDDRTAGEIMTREVISVAPHTTLREIADLLIEHKISGVPVVEVDGTVVGVVSETDLINEDKRRIAIPRSALFGLFPIPEAALREAFDDGERLTAADLMTRHPYTATEETSAREICRALVEKHVNRVPVVRDRKLVGVITRADILRALHEHAA
jgi:CBS domain-containing protein